MPFCAGGNILNIFSEPYKSAESLNVNNGTTKKWVSVQMASQVNSTTFKEETVSILYTQPLQKFERGNSSQLIL